VPRRLTPIFRDQDELPASGSLGAQLQDALKNSMFLIVICSPASAKSKWVDEEIRQFKILHGCDRVLALIVDGEPNTPPEASEQECFAPALKFVVAPDGELTKELSEPIAADMRLHADGKKLAKLKLISGLTGLRLDDLVQREAARRMRTLVQISLASFLAAVFAVGLAVYADAQRKLAEREAATAQAVSDFLVESFKSANSAQQNPNEVSARSILDSGAKRLGTQLEGQPLVQNRLSATIAIAFNNLGLFNEAIDIVDSTAKLSGEELSSAFLIKAEALVRIGDLDGAMQTAQYTQTLLDKESSSMSGTNPALIRSAIARIKGHIHYKRGEFDAGRTALDEALQALINEAGLYRLETAQLLQTRALLLSDMGDMVNANADLEKAKNLALESVGSSNILVGDIALAQAQVNFLSWNLEPALEQVNLALENMQRMLEDDNPFLADAISMKGQILQALGQLDEAEEALTEAVNIYTKAYSGRHYLSGIAEVYLGLIAGEKKDLIGALAHFEQAKLHYDESYGEIHANHGDLLVNQASVLASLGDLPNAVKDCKEGMEILNNTLGKEAAFTQQLQTVCDNINGVRSE
jgi:tetratricopeptide (TPR) repeat protein